MTKTTVLFSLKVEGERLKKFDNTVKTGEYLDKLIDSWWV